MIEKINELLKAGKTSEAGMVLANHADEFSEKEFNSVNKMIKNYPVVHKAKHGFCINMRKSRVHKLQNGNW